MKRYGLIGKGISDSGSPAMFKAAYSGRYAYDLLDGDDFTELLERFREGYDAVNVTSPFKEAAFTAADEVSEAASLCGAANMLIKLPGGKIQADNSDFEGVTLSLMSAFAIAGVDVDDEDAFADYLAGRTALIIGCGGAGRAAAAAAVTLGYGKTMLTNRTASKAEAVKKHISEFYGDLTEGELEVTDISRLKDAFAEADTVICAVSGRLDFPLQNLNPDKDKIVMEADYKTPQFERFKDRYSYVSGLNWLFNQAVVAYETFTGEEPDEEGMKKIL